MVVYHNPVLVWVIKDREEAHNTPAIPSEGQVVNGAWLEAAHAMNLPPKSVEASHFHPPVPLDSTTNGDAEGEDAAEPRDSMLGLAKAPK
jgi:hypothetical protein